MPLNQEDIIKARKRELIKLITFKFMDFLVRGFIASKAPFLLSGILGKIVDLFLNRLLDALAEFAAANGYSIGVKFETALKIVGMNAALKELAEIEAGYDPSRPMTPEEKEANDKANKDIDDSIGWK